VITLFGIVLPLLAATITVCPRAKHGGNTGGRVDTQWRAGAQERVLWLTLPAPEIRLSGGLAAGKNPQSAMADGRLVPVPAIRVSWSAWLPMVATTVAARRPAWVGVVEIRV